MNRVVLDGLASRQEVQLLARCARKAKRVSPPFTSHHKFVDSRELAAYGSPKLLETVDAVRSRIRDEVKRHFGIKRRLFIESTTIVRMEKGALHDAHFDNCDVNLRVGRRKPNPFPFRKFSAILYLTDHGRDFSGGEFQFMSLRRHRNSGAELVDDGPAIEPKAGMLLMFKSGVTNPHQVLKVTRGLRCAMALFFSIEHAHAEPRSIWAAQRAIFKLHAEKSPQFARKLLRWGTSESLFDSPAA